MKKKLSEHIKSFSFHIMYYQSHFGSFCRRFLKNIFYFCDSNGPLPNVIFSGLYFKHSVLNWRLKFVEITECIISNHSSEVNWKLIEKIIKFKSFFCSWFTLRKRHILRLGPLVIPLLTKTLIIYLKIVSIYSNLLWNLKIWCLRNFSLM